MKEVEGYIEKPRVHRNRKKPRREDRPVDADHERAVPYKKEKRRDWYSLAEEE